jgi:hypothetical protein
VYRKLSAVVGGIFQAYDGAKHSSTISTRFGFSNAAATRSLSFSCLLTAQKIDQDRKQMLFYNSYALLSRSSLHATYKAKEGKHASQEF